MAPGGDFFSGGQTLQSGRVAWSSRGTHHECRSMGYGRVPYARYLLNDGCQSTGPFVLPLRKLSGGGNREVMLR